MGSPARSQRRHLHPDAIWWKPGGFPPSQVERTFCRRPGVGRHCQRHGDRRARAPRRDRAAASPRRPARPYRHPVPRRIFPARPDRRNQRCHPRRLCTTVFAAVRHRDAVVPIPALLLALGSAFAVGIYPALRAARFSPAEGLRAVGSSRADLSRSDRPCDQ
jgi:hypothetical protein